MPRTIAITNQKGGVGKTTTAVNLASTLAHAGYRLLLVDMDPQGNASGGSGIAINHLETSIYQVLLGTAEFSDALCQTDHGFHVAPSHRDLVGAQVELGSFSDKEFRLKHALREVDTDYDFILIDCAPTLNILTINALAAANEVLVPVQCEYYALEGLSSLIKTIELVREKLNPGLKIAGLVRTMYDVRNRLSIEVSEQLGEHFPDSLYRTVIPRNVRLAEAPSYGQPILEYDRKCSGSKAYVALASEVLRKSTRVMNEVQGAAADG
ncbi:MAG: AAA family ATPase [Gammaproteobacteria bacterium]|nr:AAA family ATPase [Gammaproteobacteria bacterium]